MPLWQRARQPDQKALRRKTILNAAADLFEKKGFEGASMRAIACRARLSKANLYRYFRTKEELFLQLYLEDLERWVSALENTLARQPGRGDISWIAVTFTKSITGHQRMAAMIPLLASVMERNLPVEVLFQFKITIHEQLERVVRALCLVLPELAPEQGGFFVSTMAALLAGLWPMTHPAPDLEAILARDELRNLRPDFSRDLTRAINSLLHGLLGEQRTTQ